MIDISHINVGDKVKVTRTNGDSAEFVVTSIAGPEHPTRWMDGEYDEVTVNDDIRGIEVIERAKKPLPTEPGYYALEDTHFPGGIFRLNANGKWQYNHHGDLWIATEVDSAEQFLRLVPEVTP